MNCESVHTHWIVLCLRARRTSDDPDLGELTAAVDGQPHPVCPETSSPRVITPTMKMNRSQGEIFFLYLFIHFLLKSAVESRGSRADILISGWQSATWMCWRNLGGGAARVGGQRERRGWGVGGVKGWRSREKWQLVHRRRGKQDWTQMGEDSRWQHSQPR